MERFETASIVRWLEPPNMYALFHAEYLHGYSCMHQHHQNRRVNAGFFVCARAFPF
ncbi:MAG TPA: hypothetical protein VKB35_08815 [Ktedonobacteraceae bacterium]|nr:hypothetical protein [Ktedonobacteraceae bacterium]